MSIETETKPDATTAVANLIKWLETAEVPDGLFAPDLFSDINLPFTRVQGNDVDGMLGIRRHSHPFTGTVHVNRVDPTDRGFVIEFDERWEDQGQRWYARELIRADVVGATIVDISVYCTGDWDERRQAAHAE